MQFTKKQSCNNSISHLKKLKKYLTYFFIGLSVLFLIALFASRNVLNTYVSKLSISQVTETAKDSLNTTINKTFNYTQNGKPYRITFLEFGAKGCSACRKMEDVMTEVKTKYPDKVNVIFLNILIPENQPMSQYFGIAQIPTQVLLNEQGKEFFRHLGFYSFEELTKEFQKHGLL